MFLLSFQDVTFGYRKEQPLLRNLSFSLRPGQAAAVLGPNGRGKTTLLSLAVGWLTPWQGSVCFQGTSIAVLSARQRGQHIALVPQIEHTPFDYAALEYVLMGRTPHLPPLEMPPPMMSRLR